MALIALVAPILPGKRSRGIGAVISRQKRERRTQFDKAAYRQRHWVERLVNRLKAFRRIATRYE